MAKSTRDPKVRIYFHFRTLFYGGLYTYTNMYLTHSKERAENFNSYSRARFENTAFASCNLFQTSGLRLSIVYILVERRDVFGTVLYIAE